MTSSSLRLTSIELVALLCTIGAAGICDAQPPIMFGVTGGLSSQRNGDSDLPYIGPGLGGTALGGAICVDAEVMGRVSLGGEVSAGTNVTSHQQQRASGGNNSLNSRHHDTIFSGVLKFTVFDAPRAHVAAAFGVGAGWRHTNRHGTFRSDLPPFSTTAVEQTLSNVVLATTIGFDGALVVSPRTALLWTGRFHVLIDDDRQASGVVRRGVGSTIFRFGGGARLRF